MSTKSVSTFGHRYTTKTSGEFIITTGRKVEVIGTFTVHRDKGKVNTEWKNKEVIGRADDILRRNGIRSVNTYVRKEILNKSGETVHRNDKDTKTTKDKGTKDKDTKDTKDTKTTKDTKDKGAKDTKEKEKGTKEKGTKTKGVEKSTPQVEEPESKDPFRLELRTFEANDRKSKGAPWFKGELWSNDGKGWRHLANVGCDGKEFIFHYEVTDQKRFDTLTEWVKSHPDVKRFKVSERLDVFLEDALEVALKRWEVLTKFVAKAIKDGVTLWRLDHDPVGSWRQSGKWTKKVHESIRKTAKSEHASIDAILAPEKLEPKLFNHAINRAVAMFNSPE